LEGSSVHHNLQQSTQTAVVVYSMTVLFTFLYNRVLDDRRMKVRELAETIGISTERVGYILHEELDMKKLCTRWLSCLLKTDQKRTRMKISEHCLERFNKN
jgi:DNA-binding Xre family transcriptional regulator